MDVTKTDLSGNTKELLIVGDGCHGICCCCLETSCRKSVWTEYTWMGCTEVYNDMLQECFGLAMSQEQGITIYICELCITMLRNALYFRRQVARCHAEIVKQIATNEEVTPESVSVHRVKEDRLSEDMFDNYFQDEDLKTNSIDITPEKMEKSCDDDKVKLATQKRTDETNRKSNYMKTRQNICLILEHSTLIPFRSNKGYFNCFYCSKQHAVFDELKSHMADEHTDINFQRIMKCILRPDVVKADCSNVSCKLCWSRFTNVEELIQHLNSVHNVLFNHENSLKPKDCILPYNLSDGRYRCSVCDKEFLFFKTLSKHMNEHNANYICEECGKCFSLPERLRAHKQRHADKSAIECDQCGKVCSSSIILKSHIRYNHKKVVYVCSICNETYRSFKERLKHMEIVHGRKLNLNCEFCAKSFKTPCSLNVHVKNEHLNIVSEGKFSCAICRMTFKSRSALKCHAIVHTGERNFECELCHKRYGRSRTLREHLKIHRNDKRWSCAECRQAFVQKCSLRNHIRVHHSSQDADLLILYKKKALVKPIFL